MARSVSMIKQSDATKLFKAAKAAGSLKTNLILHPDGRLEAAANFDDAVAQSSPKNSWDEVL